MSDTNIILQIVRLAKRHMDQDSYEAFLLDLDVLIEQGETPTPKADIITGVLN